MALTGKNQKVQEDGQEKDGLVFTFTNGAKEQIEELKKFLKASTELDVIKFGISILENYKEEKIKKESENGSHK